MRITSAPPAAILRVSGPSAIYVLGLQYEAIGQAVYHNVDRPRILLMLYPAPMPVK